MKTIEILVGIPCSGKSTYCNKYLLNFKVNVLSRNTLRLFMFGDNYKQNNKSETLLTEIFNKQLITQLSDSFYNTIILDNIHCKEKYIDEIIIKYSVEHNIRIKFFDIPLYKAHYRNIIRYFKTGKWIPIKIMNNMYKNYNKINKQKYAKYLVHQ
jgi:predicted kinase